MCMQCSNMTAEKHASQWPCVEIPDDIFCMGIVGLCALAELVHPAAIFDSIFVQIGQNLPLGLYIALLILLQIQTRTKNNSNHATMEHSSVLKRFSCILFLFCAELLGLGLVAQAGEQGRNGSPGIAQGFLA